MGEVLAQDDLEGSIGDRFDAVAARCGRTTAIRTPRGEISYDELRTRTDAAAFRVAEHAATRRDARPPIVVSFLPQGIDAIAAQLGILKAGACYVPADVRQAAAQLTTVARHAGASLVITDGPRVAFTRTLLGPGVDVVDIADAVSPVACTGQLPSVAPTTLAYIYYTSGSTGQPKGVADTHQNVVHNILRYTRTLAIGPHDRLSLLQPPCFSGAVSSTYCALLNGATLLAFDLHDDGPLALARWLDENAVTIYHSVPAIFRSFVAGRAAFAALRHVRLEGDRALAHDARLFRAHFPPACRLVNGLGTTETGIVRQFFVDHATEVDDGPLPIGYAVPGVECFVAGADGRPAADEEVGEIVVQSAYLAHGYWRDAPLTAAKFVTGADNQRRYRTGDLGRMRDDGCLEYHGRSGTQRRIRGMTVDLAEIERAIVGIPGVLDAAATTIEHAAESTGLAALVAVARDSPLTPATLRAALADVLPSHAVPGTVEIRDALPLTAFGKIDRCAVARMADERAVAADSGEDGRAGSAIEMQVARIWQAVLGETIVHVDIPFLDAGGDSLRAMQILMRLQDELGVRMSPAEFFGLPTVSSQARFVEAKLRSAREAEETDVPGAGP